MRGSKVVFSFFIEKCEPRTVEAKLNDPKKRATPRSGIGRFACDYRILKLGFCSATSRDA
jgi:hypothetical protein